MPLRAVTAFSLVLSIAGLVCARPASGADPSWQQTLRDRLPVYGHRNWIVIADSAYPSQSREGIETIVASADQLEVLRRVLAQLAASRHVRPIVYTDKELSAVPEADAPGISQYRRNLAGLLPAGVAQSLPHEQIIAKLDDAAKTFRVLIIKTDMTLPYTSVFLQLDCAYWSADAERRLREAMETAPSR
jgi:hypothetical protein